MVACTMHSLTKNTIGYHFKNYNFPPDTQQGLPENLTAGTEDKSVGGQHRPAAAQDLNVQQAAAKLLERGAKARFKVIPAKRELVLGRHHSLKAILPICHIQKKLHQVSETQDRGKYSQCSSLFMHFIGPFHF